MLQWNDLHPYNAVHVVRLLGAVDLDRLRQGIQALIERYELAALTLDRARGTYRLEGRPGASEFREIPADGNPDAAFRREIERQLNTPFPLGQGCAPLRFFLLPAREGFLLGLVYLHVIADAEPVVRFLRQLTEHYLGRPTAEAGGSAPERRSPEGALAGWGLGLLARQLADLPRRVRAIRACCRPPAGDALDLANRWTGLVLGAEELEVLLGTARRRGVTLNDLVLALLLKCVARLAPERRWASRRRRLAVGCIVNTRPGVRLETQAMVGVSLGSFVVTHDVPNGITVGELAREVSGQTRPMKQHRLWLGPSLELALARWWFAWSSPERQRLFYRKHYPLWGGVTNLNLNRLWDQSPAAAPIDYYRAVSTGPATPLVLAFTTVGRHANLGFTYRSGVFTAAEMESLTQEFQTRVNALRSER